MQRKRANFKDYAVAGLLTVLLVWLVWLNVGIFKKEEIARTTAHITAAQLASLQTRQQTLQSNINELSTERGEEATLRETFGVAKPGEGVIIVVPQVVASTTPPEPWYQKWFGWMLFWDQPAATSTPANDVAGE